MGAFFHDPVGDGIQFIQARTGMGIKFQDGVFPAPQVLHAGQGIKDETHIAAHGAVQVVECIGYHLRVPGLVDAHDLVRPLGAVFFVKLAEHLAAIALAMGKAVQDGQVLILRQGTEVFQKGAGGSIKGDVNQGLVLILGFLDEIQAENRRQRAGIVVPDDVVTDKQPA